MRRLSTRAFAIWSVFTISSQALALEGGTGAYLLGSRDSLAGIVPGPGTYVTNNSVFMDTSAPTLSLSGVPVTAPEAKLYINKTDISHFFAGQVLGGTPGIIVSVPIVTGDIEGNLLPDQPFQRFKDNDTGFGDLTITPVIGWHDGNFHYSLAVSIFAPTGEYDSAEIGLNPPRTDNLLNFGKNKWMFMPTLSATHLDPQSGFEVSGSLGIGFSTLNTATDWQTAPELVFETAALQHLPNGIAFGATGYLYHQLGEDSGSGAEDFKTAIGADSLVARVFGAGPIITYSTMFGSVPVSMKAKYIHEFGGKRRFEGQVFWASFSAAFPSHNPVTAPGK